MTERKRGSLHHVATVQPITAAMLPSSRGSRWEERERGTQSSKGEREAEREKGGNPHRRRSWSLLQHCRRCSGGASLSPRATAIEASASALLLLLSAVVPLDIAASEPPVTGSLLLNPLSLVLCLLIVAQPLFRPAWKEACATLQKLLS
ncbi:hypothetical protein HN51_031242, partial [Arachis hypogaea]